MSYQALARKWRPQTFGEVIGQEHVVSALANALDSERVHHAYLFTGTRGVGKTTLARIFARALNCETGVSASPCGECAACIGVSQGNYIDLIEVDAASRTRVDDTRELLDNVQYAPTVGRFKIYLIDEVHMLSTHSFNALLKTLEEPPAHVKFLLATTDPQKLPATILSRCIQFNLKAMDVERLFAQLEKILTAEQLSFEPEALNVLARSADGSVRDALSLLDQAIAFGNGQVETVQVRSMLGMIDNDFTRQLLADVCANAPAKVMTTVAQLAERSVDFKAAMDDLLTMLHHIALYQVSPEAVAAKGIDVESVSSLSGQCDAELTQLLYQIALLGKRDLAMAPDPRTGFEMALLRMTSFQPQSSASAAPADSGAVVRNAAQPSQPQASGSAPASRSAVTDIPTGSGSPDIRANGGSRIQRDPARVGGRPEPVKSQKAGDPAARPEIAHRKFVERPAVDLSTAVTATDSEERPAAVSEPQVPSLPMDNPPPVTELPPNMIEEPSARASVPLQPAEPVSPDPAPGQIQQAVTVSIDYSALGTAKGWTAFAEKGGIEGISKELAMNMVPKTEDNGLLTLLLDERAKHLFNDARLEKLNAHVSAASNGNGPRLQVCVEAISNIGMETPNLSKQRQVEETQQAAEQSFREDPNVQELVNLFDAEVIDDSVRPANT